MNNSKSLFWITLVISGLIIMIGTIVPILSPGTRLFTNWYEAAGVLTLTTFLVGIYGIIRSKLVCQFICKRVTDGKNNSPPRYRIEQYVLRHWNHQYPIENNLTSVDLINTPGRRSRYSDIEKRRAVEKWEKIKQHPNGVTLEEFLESEFGITSSILNVSKSSFYYWRRQFGKRNIKEQKH